MTFTFRTTTVLDEEKHELPLQDLARRFRVVEAYAGGEGWSGAVRDADGATAILKVLDAGSELHEASLLASLRHPRIPRILEHGRESGRAYLLREFIDGTPLQHDLPLSADSTLRLASQLLEMLAYVHLRGLLHLDIKPANVLRAGPADAPEFHLLDFGLGARGSDHRRAGTPFFAAPERLLGLPSDARTDLFSLGAVLFAALWNRRSPIPLTRFLARFPRESFFEALDFDAAELPHPFDEVLPRMLAAQPGDRFLDAQEALEALTGRTGRPSRDLLRPDPIEVHRHRIDELVSALGDEDLLLTGESKSVRRALAIHVATALPSRFEVVVEKDAVRIARGGGAARRWDIPELGLGVLSRHLRTCLGLEQDAALDAARLLLDRSDGSIAAVDGILQDLVDSGGILPDGTAWHWPDAMSGRLEIRLSEPSDDIGRLAARGRVEAALAAYARQAPELDDTTDRRIRMELARGLVRAGEPARALPLVADLPGQRARVLLDLGRIDEADRAASAVAVDDEFTTEAERLRLTATIELLRGRASNARDLLEATPRPSRTPELEIVLCQARMALGEHDLALRHLTPLVAELESGDAPFLLAAALTSMAECERRRGDLVAAGSTYRRVQELLRRLGHVRHSATTSTNLGVIAKDLGHFEEALGHQRRARAMFRHVGDRRGEALATANYGIASLSLGDAGSAIRRLAEARDMFEGIGVSSHLSMLDMRMAQAHLAAGDLAAARSSLERIASDATPEVSSEARRIEERLVEAERSALANDDAPREDPTVPMLDKDDRVPKQVFRTFLAVNRRLASGVDLDRAMGYLLDAAVTLTGGRNGFLLVVRDGGVKQEFHSGEADSHGRAFSRSMVHRAIQTRRTQTSDEALADRDLLEMSSVQEFHHRSAICAPFHSAAGTQGALYVEHPTRAGAFSDSDKEHLEVLADQAAIAVDRMENEERLREQLEQSQRELTVVRRSLPRKSSKMLGKSPAMRALRETIERVASSNLPILVRGETGSGKELVARAIHEQSPRARGPFVAENCSAIPESLVESEFFGHVKGAFTGADSDHAGLLELANGGTLFLDEIGDMPSSVQVKLLRVIQESSLRRVGGSETIPVDVRLVSATHKDPATMIREGTFREDLYYRLAAVEIAVPPLRERGRDVRLLAESFLAELNREHGRAIRFSADALDALSGYTWPGNVRELRHVVARAYLLAEADEIAEIHPPKEPAPESTGGATSWPVITIADAEHRTIDAALRATGGDKTKAAKVLGISRTALYEKLRRRGETRK